MKEDVVAAQLQAIQDGEKEILTQALGACYDAGAVDQKASDGTLTQGDVDAAVAAAVAPLNDQIAALQAQDAADIQIGADAKAALADLQAKFDALVEKENIEAGIVDGLKGSLVSLQDVVTKLAALQPAPAPAE